MFTFEPQLQAYKVNLSHGLWAKGIISMEVFFYIYSFYILTQCCLWNLAGTHTASSCISYWPCLITGGYTECLVKNVAKSKPKQCTLKRTQSAKTGNKEDSYPAGNSNDETFSLNSTAARSSSSLTSFTVPAEVTVLAHVKSESGKRAFENRLLRTTSKLTENTFQLFIKWFSVKWLFQDTI